MGRKEYLKKIEAIRKGLSDKDFEKVPTKYWRIRIVQSLKGQTPFFYMNCAFDSEKAAFSEFEKIIINRFEKGVTRYFEIKVVSGYSRKLKKPISIS